MLVGSQKKVFIIARAKKAAVELGGDAAAACIGGKKWHKGFMSDTSTSRR
jgi:hypothetical protein